jgi:hypothetical protein
MTNFEFPYECPVCSEGHDGTETGTELCPSCANEPYDEDDE